MAALDWIILVLFFSGLVGIVLWVIKHKKDNTSDYFLSGRSETWLAVGAAIFAANIGSEHLVDGQF
jgi:SSS family solute:Na+ symporter